MSESGLWQKYQIQMVKKKLKFETNHLFYEMEKIKLTMSFKIFVSFIFLQLSFNLQP